MDSNTIRRLTKDLTFPSLPGASLPETIYHTRYFIHRYKYTVSCPTAVAHAKPLLYSFSLFLLPLSLSFYRSPNCRGFQYARSRAIKRDQREILVALINFGRSPHTFHTPARPEFVNARVLYNDDDDDDDNVTRLRTEFLREKQLQTIAISHLKRDYALSYNICADRAKRISNKILGIIQ